MFYYFSMARRSGFLMSWEVRQNFTPLQFRLFILSFLNLKIWKISSVKSVGFSFLFESRQKHFQIKCPCILSLKGRERNDQCLARFYIEKEGPSTSQQLKQPKLLKQPQQQKQHWQEKKPREKQAERAPANTLPLSPLPITRETRAPTTPDVLTTISITTCIKTP